eukprot:TRINITY_DN3190_c0_g1_i1.p1 TRINITY_DN3190_c0_g1~~TRINITY_DN3190_c0_g1_i1.p1  ORF type:complete len:345 (-),score=67.85 TRINITY_DN3190_c0_g1_i1:204-1205(-)
MAPKNGRTKGTSKVKHAPKKAVRKQRAADTAKAKAKTAPKKSQSSVKRKGAKATHTNTAQWNGSPFMALSQATFAAVGGLRTLDARGWRAKIGVIAPSTNTIVQPDLEDIRAAIPGGGVTNHMGRITCPNASLKTDEDFARFQVLIADEVDLAADRVMTAKCDWLAMGMSAPTFFGGYAACVEKRDRLSQRLGGVGISSGSFSCEAALKCFGAKNIAVLSPYAQIGDVEVTRFFTEAGFNVIRFKGLRCENPIAIAEVSPEDIRKYMKELDGDDIDALVQVGTNLSAAVLVPELEAVHNKPVIAINTATYWHALRALGIKDRIRGFGRLLELF